MTVEQKPQLKVDAGWGRRLDLQEVLQPTLGDYFTPGSELGLGIASALGIEITGYGSEPLLEAAHSAIWPTLLELPSRIDSFDREHGIEHNGARRWILNPALSGNLEAPTAWTPFFVGEDGLAPEIGESLLALAYLSHAATLLNHVETTDKLPEQVGKVLEEAALSDVRNAVEHLANVSEVMERVKDAIEEVKPQLHGSLFAKIFPKG